MSEQEKPSMSVREAGRRGGRRTRERHGIEHYQRMGKLGGRRVKELTQRGHESERAEQGETP